MNTPWTPQALSLDLDDTLWPIWPAIARAERMMTDWLRERAPATIEMHDGKAMRALRAQVVADRPDWRHDLSALRRETIRRALLAGGDDPGLAEPAFELFFSERQKVELYDDARPALERLSRRWRIVAVTNGNADLSRVGIAGYFVASLSARQLGVAKPDAQIFHAACRAVGVQPDGVLHIGDDPALDVDGALDAGLRAAWVQRPGQVAQGTPRGEPQHHVADLMALADRLGA
jgi:putative hydrolase of the HAD superfamily